jgi:hypothetical protein
MQMDQIKPAFHRIAHRKVGIKIGGPRRSHGSAVKRKAGPFMR